LPSRPAICGAISLALETVSARLYEIVSASTGSIYTEGKGRWWLDVLGKGSKRRRLPVRPDLLEAYGAYHQAFELLPQASRADRTPPVLSSRPRELARVTDEAASGAIKAIFADAARAADAGCDQDTAQPCARRPRTGCATAC
jgi:hypothetical protein